MAESTIALSDRVMRGAAWHISAKLILFCVRFGVLVVLARLLPVDAFGLISLSLTVTSLATILNEVGMLQALIQCKSLSEQQVRVAFTVATASGLVLSASLLLGADLLASLFQMAEVAPVLRLLALIFLFKGLSTTAEALLRRNLQFRKLSVIDVASYCFSFGVAGITLALSGYGVWALAWAHVIAAFVEAALLFKASPHSIKPSFAFKQARRLLGFGGGETLSRICNYVAVQADYFVAGRWLGPAALGLYSRAYNLMVLPTRELNVFVNTIIFPAYAEIQDEDARLRRAFLASVSLAMIALAPMMVTISVVAPDLINGVFGSKWAGAVAPLQVLCLGGLFRSFGLSDSLACAKGAVYARLWRLALYALLVIAGALIGSRWGISGIAAGVVCALVITYAMMTQLALKLIGLSWKAYFFAIRPGLIIAAAIAGLTIPLSLWLRRFGLSHLSVLFITSLAAAAAGLAAALLLPARLYEEPALYAIKAAWSRATGALGSLRSAGSLRWQAR